MFLGSLVGGVLGLGSTLIKNHSAKKEAQRNRDFQEEMSNTSVQRRIADLKAAGLNPLLAVQSAQGGASTPSGAQADIEKFDPNSINLLSSARLMNAQAKQVENDNELQDFRRQGAKLANDLLTTQNNRERVGIYLDWAKKNNIDMTTEKAEKEIALLDKELKGIGGTPAGETGKYVSDLFGGGTLGGILGMIFGLGHQTVEDYQDGGFFPELKIPDSVKNSDGSVSVSKVASSSKQLFRESRKKDNLSKERRLKRIKRLTGGK